MQRKHIISLCILLCALAVLVAFRPSADETVPLTGSASAGLILLDGQSGGYYVLAVIDQSRADRAGIEAGDTLLTLALRAESGRSVDYLLGLEDIDVTKRNRFGESPLMLAVFKANDKAMEAILERGGLPNERHGWSALHYAATQGNDEYVKKLLSLGADPNVRTNQGVTPLHMAARLPSRSVILTLLRAGAYRNYCTTSGLSPADFAKKAGDDELAKYLAIERCVKPKK